MLTLTFGKTKKHPVDTSRSMYDTMDVYATLKDSVDVKAPIFIVNFDPSNYNYVSWAREDGPTRYYWIDNAVYVHNNIFEVHCSMDIMATYRDIIQTGLTGKLLYTTQDDYWDRYFDDLRFSPSSLDVYDSNPIFPDDEDDDDPYTNSWLAEHSNVFGDDNVGMWDVVYDVDGKIVSYGDGCYLAQVQNDAGISTYIFNKAAFDKFFEDMLTMPQWTGPFSTVDPRTFIKLCVWLPINVGALANAISSRVAQPTWYLGHYSIGTPDALQGESSWQIPYTTILSFAGEIAVPNNPYSHPTWMENNRWNTLTLCTPTGNTELNLDLMYPISNNHDRVQFNTMFDVCNGRINTKYTYDVRGHWSNIAGTPIYESDFQIGWDIMGLVTAVTNLTDGAVNAVMTGAGLAAGAFMGGMTAGTGVGLAKIKAAKEMQNSSLNLKQNGEFISTTMMKQGIRETTKDIAPITSVVASGAAVSKLTPKINNTVTNLTTITNRASFYNTVQLGAVSLRMKPFRCKELANDYAEISEYPTPYDKYVRYCEQFGYPANVYIRNLYLDGHLGDLYIFEDAHLDLSSINSIELNGITDEELSAIEQIARSGFYYN